MDKIDQRKQRNIYILFGLGLLLALTILVVDRDGLSWFGQVAWSGISWLQWLSLAILLIVALLTQYFLLLLLHFSRFKYLVLAVIPIVWLLNNGIIAMSRFLDWTTDIGATIGWLSFTDLISWMGAAVYFPVLLGTGAMAAIIDANASMLSEACYYARMALDVAGVSPWQLIDFGMNILSITWDLVANSFSQEVIMQTSDTDSLFAFSLQGLMSMPGWISSTGYNLACLCL